MRLEASKDWNFIRWVNGLGLMTRTWAKPFLCPMGLPSQLCDEPELWSDLYWIAREQYNCSANIVNYSLYPDQSAALSQIGFEVLKSAFEALALRTDTATVESLYLWYHRHFEITRFDSIVRSWRRVLINAIWTPESLASKSIVPACFELIKSDLSHLVWSDSEYFRLELLKVPVTFLLEINEPDANEIGDAILSRTNENGIIEDSEYEDPFGDAGIILEVINGELILKAIKIINSSPERQQLMEWFYSVANSLECNSFKLSDRDVLDMLGLEKF
jgi:hypothetical protein